MWTQIAPKICLGLIFLTITALPVVGAVASAPETGQVAVLFSPNSTRAEQLQAAAQADVTIVRFGALPGTVIVQMDTPAAQALRHTGAWLIADPIILGGCNSRPQSL